MTTPEPAASGWLREQIRRQTDPAERTATRHALMRRLFGTQPDDEPEDNEPSDAA